MGASFIMITLHDNVWELQFLWVHLEIVMVYENVTSKMLFYTGKCHKAKKTQVKLYYFTTSTFYEGCAGPYYHSCSSCRKVWCGKGTPLSLGCFFFMCSSLLVICQCMSGMCVSLFSLSLWVLSNGNSLLDL